MPKSSSAIVSGKAKSSSRLTAKNAGKQPFLRILRELAQTYQAFCTFDEPHIRSLGLTSPQFDVIATLGNTDGMMMQELAQKTLVTKGTLTGIVDRLEGKGLVRREVPSHNRRCFIVKLTATGEALFQRVFPAHVAYLKNRFDSLQDEELEEICLALQKLRSVFEDE
ncbi:MAG: MarR family transcriptional regulator [Synechococcales bacterium]|nr:MarR family transcriptional regulator [Synechococcales bacterium]